MRLVCIFCRALTGHTLSYLTTTFKYSLFYVLPINESPLCSHLDPGTYWPFGGFIRTRAFRRTHYVYFTDLNSQTIFIPHPFCFIRGYGNNNQNELLFDSLYASAENACCWCLPFSPQDNSAAYPLVLYSRLCNPSLVNCNFHQLTSGNRTAMSPDCVM